jgi:hypothetical protein
MVLWLGLLLAAAPLESPVHFQRLTVVAENHPELPRPPAVFCKAGRLCVPSPDGDATCHEVKSAERGEPTRSKRPRNVPVESKLLLKLSGKRFSLQGDGSGTLDGQPVTVEQLRCRAGQLLPAGQVHFVRGAPGELAVLVLEQERDCGFVFTLGAASVCGAQHPVQWSVLYAVEQCTEPSRFLQP